MYFHKKEGRNFECVCRKFLEVSRMTRKKKKTKFLFCLFCSVLFFKKGTYEPWVDVCPQPVHDAIAETRLSCSVQEWTKGCSLLRGLHSPPPAEGRRGGRRSCGFPVPVLPVTNMRVLSRRKICQTLTSESVLPGSSILSLLEH